MNKPMTEGKWLEYYEPIMDLANDTDLWDIHDPLINLIKPGHVWTLVSGDNGFDYIEPGYCFVNRIGYYICSKAYDVNHPPMPIEIPILSDYSDSDLPDKNEEGDK